MTIEIKIPADQLALQYHIGQALRNAAIESGYDVGPELNADKAISLESHSNVMDEFRHAIKVALADIIPVTDLEHGISVQSEDADTFTQGWEDGRELPPLRIKIPGSVLSDTIKDELTNNADDTEGEQITPDTPDADGVVWDKRIHSQGQTRNADGTWRLARKPKDKSEAEWNEYVEAVKAELLAVAAAENSVTLTPNEQYGAAWEEHYGADPAPPVTETVVDPVPPVTETVADPVPPAADPVPPAADPVPPAPAVDEQLTFAKVIAFATANKSKLPPMEELNKIYADLAASMGIPVTTANAPIVAFAKAGPNVLSTLKATIEGLING